MSEKWIRRPCGCLSSTVQQRHVMTRLMRKRGLSSPCYDQVMRGEEVSAQSTPPWCIRRYTSAQSTPPWSIPWYMPPTTLPGVHLPTTTPWVHHRHVRHLAGYAADLSTDRVTELWAQEGKNSLGNWRREISSQSRCQS